MEKIHFVHIPKTGGVTIRKAPELKDIISTSGSKTHISEEYTKKLLETMNQYREHHGYEHARWRDLKPEIRQRKCFSIVRNPWSKVVSRYTFLLHEFSRIGSTIRKNSNYKKCSFEEFLEERHVWGNKEYFWHRAIRGWYPQFDHVSSDNGILMCDILRLEKFNEDVGKYFNLNNPLRPRNISNIDKKDYRDFYNTQTK